MKYLSLAIITLTSLITFNLFASTSQFTYAYYYCDGGLYQDEIGSFLTSEPELRGRFVVLLSKDGVYLDDNVHSSREMVNLMERSGAEELMEGFYVTSDIRPLLYSGLKANHSFYYRLANFVMEQGCFSPAIYQANRGDVSLLERIR